MYSFSMLIPRFVLPGVRSRLQQRPVVIIEGARAVGKTSLLGTLAAHGDINQIVTLTDPATLRAATEHPTTWLRGLRQPFAIDEAQLAPELPLALKSLLDESHDELRCVLTGSASIGRTGLGGSDPLARRSSWLTLEPLSEAELAAPQQAWSILDLLFEAEPQTGSRPYGEDWASHARLGGMPSYRLAPQRLRRGMDRRIIDDLGAVLTDRVLPDERLDVRIARDVLLRVLRHPAGELKVEPIGDALDLHRATVNRYLDILERRFLITELPNLRRPARQGTRATSKVYPGDTSLSAAALAVASRSNLDSDASRGGLMEAHVVQQLRAHRGWSDLDVELFHWRDNRQGRTVEVDVVLQDNEGRIVALEVKSGSTPRPSDLRGITTLREQYPDTFHRGFIIAGDGAIAPLDDDGKLWRIPVSALSDPHAWATTHSSTTHNGRSIHGTETLPEAPMNPTATATIFMSYAHKDQESASGGDLRQFSEDVQDELLGAHERTARVIIDEKDVLWGDSLWDRLHQEIDASIYFLPYITPRYVSSDACRREFERFDAATVAQDDERRILPLLWMTPRALHQEGDTDPLLNRVRELRYVDATEVRHADRSSTEYRRAVAKVAEELAAVIDSHESAVTGRQSEDAPSSNDESADDEGFLEVTARIEDAGPALQNELEEMMEALSTVSDLIGQSSGTSHDTPGAIRKEYDSLAAMLTGPSAILERSAVSARTKWQDLLTDLGRAARLSRDLGEPVPQDIKDDFDEWSSQLREIDDLSTMQAFAISLPNLHSGLAPASRAILAAIQTIESIQTGLSAAPGLD